MRRQRHHNYRFIGAALVCWMMGVTSLHAQPGDLSAFPFLRIEPSARAAALAGAFSSLSADDVNTLFYNPALIQKTMHRSLSASYLNHLADINAGFLAYAHEFRRTGTLAFGVRYLSYGSFERADENGFRDGSTFGASDLALTVGVSRSYSDRLRYGGSVHGIVSHIDDAGASALAADAGLFYQFPAQQVGLSLTVHNLGFMLDSFGEESDGLPFDVRFGASKQLRHLPLLVTVMGYNLHDMSGDGNFPNDVLEHIALGSEISFGEVVYVRVGYNHRRHESLKSGGRLDLAGVGLGFGINVTRVRFDYAYNDWSALGGLHQLTLQTRL